jgi:2'-5' RNA ligase
MSADPAGAARRDHIRYGVFLRPDPRTCAAVTTIANQIRAQYGLVSAARFPPHLTLAGSLPLADDPDAALDRLLATLDAVLAGTPPVPIVNAGIGRLGPGLVYDLHRLPPDRPNEALVDLAAAVQSAVRPLLAPDEPGRLSADLHERDAWRGHVSLASHELVERADLRDEIEEYARGLEVAVPARFSAEVVSLYRFVHPSWTGPWWKDFEWTHVRSRRLGR